MHLSHTLWAAARPASPEGRQFGSVLLLAAGSHLCPAVLAVTGCLGTEPG